MTGPSSKKSVGGRGSAAGQPIAVGEIYRAASTPVARPDEVRRYNRATVLRLLHAGGPRTRAELAAELGLNRSTIKALVDGLAAAGMVEERVPRPGRGAGRPSLLVLPQAESVVVLAIDVRVEHIAIALVGLGGQILGRHSWNLRGRMREADEVITHVIESTTLLAGDLGIWPIAAGVSVPGVVRRSDGYVHEAPNLRWTGVALGQRLGKVLEIPVLVGNDAEFGAVAEHIRGIARGTSDAVYVSADVGVGGGVIADGTALRGGAGYVGEIGHMVVRPDGRPCRCGSLGCWETEIGEAALCRALGISEGTPRGAILFELKEAGRNPELAARRLAEFTQWLVLGLVNVVNFLGPKLVVLGDLLSMLPESVVLAVTEEVHSRSLVSRAVGGTRIVPSTLGADVLLIGAAEAAFEQIFNLA